MEKEVKGMVKQNPIMLEQGCLFVVEQDKDLYLILSTGMQAVKDHIFVEKGQEISIKGHCMEHMDLKGVLVNQEAKNTLVRTDR